MLENFSNKESKLKSKLAEALDKLPTEPLQRPSNDDEETSDHELAAEFHDDTQQFTFSTPTAVSSHKRASKHQLSAK